MEADLTGQKTVLIILVNTSNPRAQFSLEFQKLVPCFVARFTGVPEHRAAVIAERLLTKLGQQYLTEPLMRLAAGVDNKAVNFKSVPVLDGTLDRLLL